MNQTEQINKTEKLKELIKIYKEFTTMNTSMDVVLINRRKNAYGEYSK